MERDNVNLRNLMAVDGSIYILYNEKEVNLCQSI